MSHPFSTGESRLLSYTLQDFNSTEAQNRLNAANIAAARQANLDAQRAQEASVGALNTAAQTKVADLNKFEQDKYNYAVSQGNTYDPKIYSPTSFSRTGSVGVGNADTGITQRAGTQIVGNSGLQADGTYANTTTVDNLIQTNPSAPKILTSSGQLDQSLIERLRGQGKSDAEIRTIIADPARLASIQQTMSNTGLPSTARTQAAPPSLDQQAENYARSVVPTPNPYAPGAAEAKVAYETAVQNAKNAFYTKTSIDQNNANNAKKTAQEHATQGAASGASTAATQGKSDTAQATIPPTPQDLQHQKEVSTANAALQMMNVPPEAQGVVGAIKSIIDGMGVVPVGQEKTFGQFMKESDIGSFNDAITQTLDQARSDAKTYEKHVEDGLRKQQEDQIKYNTMKEESIQEQLVFAQNKAERDQADTDKKTQDQMTIALALRGGFGSSDGNQQIVEARNKGEQALIDLGKEFAFKRKDASIEFTKLTNDAFNNYTSAFLQANDNLTNRLSNLTLQDISNKQAKASALKGAYKDYMDEIKTGRKDAANLLLKAEEFVAKTTNELRDDKRAQEQLGWKRLEDGITKYGSFMPQGIIDSISKQLPGLDVANIAKTMTLAEMKQFKLKGQGDSGGYTFNPSQFSPTGQPPTFEKFVSDKENAFMSQQANPLMSSVDPKKNFDRSPAAMADYKKEWNTKYQAAVSLNPTEITRRFDRKVMTLTGKPLTTAKSLFNAAMNAGDLAYASQIADNTGDDVDTTTARDFTAALGSRQDIHKMSSLINEFGAMGPLTGRLRNLDPLDDRAVRFKQLITEAVPALARGTFHEVGVLTDTDRDTYTSVVGNPKLTTGQAIQAFNDLQDKIDRNMQNQIQIWDASRKSVGGFKEIYNNLPTLEKPKNYLDSLPSPQ